MVVSCRLGEVSGSLRGGPEDYAAYCQVNVGECQVAQKGTGSRPVKIEVDMGSIYLDYRE